MMARAASALRRNQHSHSVTDQQLKIAFFTVPAQCTGQARKPVATESDLDRGAASEVDGRPAAVHPPCLHPAAAMRALWPDDLPALPFSLPDFCRQAPG